MFGHKVSKLGYAFCAIGFAALLPVGMFQTWLFSSFDVNKAVFIANMVSGVGAWATICGLVMIVCGVLARGFERIEAAIVSRAGISPDQG